MKLTDEQLKAKDEIIKFIFDDTQKAIILQGHAGTGKTTILKTIKDEYDYIIKLGNALGLVKKHWQFCATTNKAVEALNANGIWAKTVHSFFGLNIYDDPVKSVSFPINHIVVIDECSYLNYKQMEYIQKVCKKVIYVGDKNQLTPVGLNHSPVYYLDIPMVELTQTIRQQNAPEVGDYCNKLREAITANSDTPTIVLGKEVIHLNQKQFEQQIKKDFTNYNGSQKILGLKNTTVQKYNNLLAKEIKAGDILINNNYHRSLDIANNAQVTIREVIKEHSVLGVKVTTCLINFNSLVHIPKSATGMARAYKQAKENNAWDTYAKFIDLRQPYAQTIHKAQGSTYSTVYIHLNDLDSVETKKERNRLLYVAFSRATDKVYLTGELP
ncbi:ATP-dependent DNA helicase [Moraxella bovis]|uniref:ATP-dependent DNA helicase n=1 Tax=Moraxella bovis TaxID=476 RepID=UPI002226705A|nr:AAA family ATPase [Moraxella bovis]UZA19157.1 AAA family ATPase [Moraxella bovis]